MKKKYLLVSIIIVIVCLAIVFGVVFFQNPKGSVKQVEFLTSFQESENPTCSPGNYGVSCKVTISFEYRGKQYTLEDRNSYSKPNCEELLGAGNCGSSNWKDKINIENNKITIKGQYDSKQNLLFNYSLSNLK
jgi:hypothetical protein